MKVGQKLMELLNSFLRVGSVLLVLLLEISLLGFVVYTLQRECGLCVYRHCSCSACR